MTPRLILTALLLAAIPLMAHAQSGYQSNELFERYHKQPHVTETLYRRPRLEEGLIAVFHSISVEAPADELLRMEAPLRRDAAQASAQETGTVGAHLYYAFLQFPSRSGRSKYDYLIFRNRSLKGKHQDATLIYLESDATLTQIRNKFK